MACSTLDERPTWSTLHPSQVSAFLSQLFFYTPEFIIFMGKLLFFNVFFWLFFLFICTVSIKVFNFFTFNGIPRHENLVYVSFLFIIYIILNYISKLAISCEIRLSTQDPCFAQNRNRTYHFNYLLLYRCKIE